MTKLNSVFLSYSPPDAELARKIAAELTKSGLVPIDPASDLALGDSWRNTIRRAVDRAQSLLVIVASPGAVGTGWSAYEIGMFDAAGKPVIVLASNSFPLSDLPVDILDNTVRTFDPSKPESAARLVAGEILAAA